MDDGLTWIEPAAEFNDALPDAEFRKHSLIAADSSELAPVLRLYVVDGGLVPTFVIAWIVFVFTLDL